MTHKTIIFILVTTFTSLININAQNSVDDIPHEFFHIFKTEPMEALDYAYSTNRWMFKQVNRIEILKNELKEILLLVGDYHGFEIITKKSIGKNLKLLSYMVRYDRQPVRFTFVLYKLKDTWRIQDIVYNLDLTGEIIESAKIDRN